VFHKNFQVGNADEEISTKNIALTDRHMETFTEARLEIIYLWVAKVTYDQKNIVGRKDGA
jgi:hypothetical protein